MDGVHIVLLASVIAPAGILAGGAGNGGGASSRGRSREAKGGVPPRVLRDYCRKTLTPQPLAESPPAPVAPDIPVRLAFVDKG